MVGQGSGDVGEGVYRRSGRRDTEVRTAVVPLNTLSVFQDNQSQPQNVLPRAFQELSLLAPIITSEFPKSLMEHIFYKANSVPLDFKAPWLMGFWGVKAQLVVKIVQSVS